MPCVAVLVVDTVSTLQERRRSSSTGFGVSASLNARSCALVLALVKPLLFIATVVAGRKYPL